MTRQHRRAAAQHHQTVRSRRAFPRHGRDRRLSADHLAAQSGDRGHRAAGRRPQPRAHRQRRHGRAVPEISGPLSGLCRRTVPDRCRRLDRGSAARGQGSRRDGRADLHQRRRRPARRAEIRTDLRLHGRARRYRSGCIRSAPLRCRIIRPRRNRASRCGGASTGRTRRPWRCCAWCSAACSTVIRTSRSSRTISAA